MTMPQNPPQNAPQNPPPPPSPPPPDAGQPYEGAPYGYTPPPGYGPPQYGGYSQPMPSAGGYAQPQGPIGQIRPTGMIMLLFFVTLGIWGFVYYFQTQEEMKRHTGEGLGGPIALLVAIIFGIVSPFFLSHEVGQLYERRGAQKPVSALTALWFFPGIFILVGPFIWFIQTNNALNAYWESVGQTRTTLV